MRYGGASRNPAAGARASSRGLMAYVYVKTALLDEMSSVFAKDARVRG
jgi:hypothetical protein